MNAIDLKVGNIIMYNKDMYRVVSTEHVKPGKGGAFIQVELKNLKNNTKLNERLRSDQSVEKINFDSRKCQFLYKNGNVLELMDIQSYEQFTMDSSVLGEDMCFLQDNMDVTVEYADNQPLFINLPENVVLEVTETQPFIRGQTAKSSFKPAILSNGITIQVPEFVTPGEKIIVSTKTKLYLERYK